MRRWHGKIKMDIDLEDQDVEIRLVAIAVLAILGSLAYMYFSSQQGPQSQAQGQGAANMTLFNQTNSGNSTDGQNSQAQNEGASIVGQNQTQNQTWNQGNETGQDNETQNGSAGIANPSSIYCIQNGGIYEIVNFTDGSQGGICLFSDASECDAWAYYRHECSSGNFYRNHDGVLVKKPAATKPNRTRND